MKSVVGSYHVYDIGGGKTRIVYRSASDSGRNVPGWNQTLAHRKLAEKNSSLASANGRRASG